MITRRSFVIALGLGAVSAHALAQTLHVFVVVIDERGAITVGGQPMANDAALSAAVRSAVASGGDQTTGRIESAAQTPHGVVAHVLDVLRGAGLTQVGISTAPVRQ
jgi:biopolymer transport protein ExbD